MNLTVYNQNGEKKSDFALPSIFETKPNNDLVHQVVNSILSSRRKPFAHTKTRGEVRGGGKKPWQQKGTGRARHGSTRSPIWVGGGVAHGPRNEKNFYRKVNKKMLKKAFSVVLSQKVKENEIILVDQIDIKEIKTKKAYLILNKIFKGAIKETPKNKNAFILSIPEKDLNVEKSFNNIKNCFVNKTNDINIIDVLNYKYIIIVNPEKSLKILSDRLS